MGVGKSRCFAPAFSNPTYIIITDNFDRREKSIFFNLSDFMWVADLSKAYRPGHTKRRVNVDFPEWMIQMLDRESKRLGITRQSIIKFWIADKLIEASQ